MANDRGLDIEKPGEITPEGAPKPGAKPARESLLEPPGVEDGVAGTAGENKVQDQ
ncbi:MAG: hypothetical protein JOY99_01850 [Sphingomonadaceae bacterium]|nr:hypothetical protein [Sphingomonadaceae bacterium]